MCVLMLHLSSFDISKTEIVVKLTNVLFFETSHLLPITTHHEVKSTIKITNPIGRRSVQKYYIYLPSKCKFFNFLTKLLLNLLQTFKF